MRTRRVKQLRTVPMGGRVRVRCNGMTWSGLAVPMGTVGTVYVHDNFPRTRAIHFDGFPLLQPNGFPFGMGGDPSKDFLPDWAEVA
jgi:hypothetical protein